MPDLLPGWTPLTSRLLRTKSPGAWNYFDDPHGTSSSSLSTEIKHIRLQPAKTTAEAKYESIRSILAASSVYRAVRESRNEPVEPPATLQATNEERIRGDSSTFLDRDYRAKPEFRSKHPILAAWIQSVEETAMRHLSSSIEFDLSQTSVQIAEYPGDGRSGYRAHLDSTGTNRIVTVILYLTQDDWCSTEDGGCLRLFHGGNDDELSYTDVVPYAGRTVVFRSDAIKHAVQPSLRRPRRAITIWLYGKDLTCRSAPKIDTIPTSAISNSYPGSNGHIDKGPPPLTCDDLDDNSSSSTIFVSIAAYRDPEIGPTLRDLFANAKFPNRLRVGLVLQIDTSPQTEDCSSIVHKLPQNASWWKDQVRLLQLDARFSTGPCNARAMAETLYRNEDYVLQIDSHMRFRQNWDVFLIQQLHKCENPHRSVLTAYPVGYNLPNEVPNETRGTLLLPWKFDSNGMLRIKGRMFRDQLPLGEDKPVKCHLYAAGFNFSYGLTITYDGTLHHLFFGEESSMAVRLFTAGYDTYAPSQTVVYHLWTRKHRPPSLAPANPEAAEQSRSKVKEQLRRRMSVDEKYSERSVDDFAKAIGVDFESLIIHPYDGERKQQLVALLGDETLSVCDDIDASCSKLKGGPSALIDTFLG